MLWATLLESVTGTSTIAEGPVSILVTAREASLLLQTRFLSSLSLSAITSLSSADALWVLRTRSSHSRLTTALLEVDEVADENAKGCRGKPSSFKATSLVNSPGCPSIELYILDVGVWYQKAPPESRSCTQLGLGNEGITPVLKLVLRAGDSFRAINCSKAAILGVFAPSMSWSKWIIASLLAHLATCTYSSTNSAELPFM